MNAVQPLFSHISADIWRALRHNPSDLHEQIWLAIFQPILYCKLYLAREVFERGNLDLILKNITRVLRVSPQVWGNTGTIERFLSQPSRAKLHLPRRMAAGAATISKRGFLSKAAAYFDEDSMKEWQISGAGSGRRGVLWKYKYDVTHWWIFFY